MQSPVRKGLLRFDRGKSMREINVSEITSAVRQMCIDTNYHLSPDMKKRLSAAETKETSPLGKQILGKLEENLSIADSDQIPICQDTGMAIVFLEIGQDVHLTGGDVMDAVNEGIREGYKDGYLRKSIVSDPLLRVNTKDNTPGVIHFSIVPGDKVRITVAPKGFGSENKSRIFMLTPADGEEGVRRAVLETVREAGPNACPPMVIGVGIGGNFEKCACLAKQALLVPADAHSDLPHIAKLEEELLSEVNATGIGPAGLGGAVTALALHILTYPTHIAGLPVAVNICCHVNRHAVTVL
jgi:fumarate hydratase subunit alpha